MKIEEAQLNQTFGADDLLNQTHAIWGGVSWPNERPGYAVVVGAGTTRHQGNYDVHVMAEFESDNTLELVRQCAALNVQYAIPRPRTHKRHSTGRWIGDYKDDAADAFIRQVNNEIKPNTHTPRFHLNTTLILEMEKVYPYIIREIQQLVNPKRRCLFLKDAKVVEYLGAIGREDVSELKLGAYPAIEALAFVVIELRRWIKQQEDAMKRPKTDVYGGWRPGKRKRA